MTPNISDVEEERRHFSNVIATFRKYTQYSLTANNRRRRDLFTLPKADQDLLASLGYKEKLNLVDDAILANAAFLNLIVANPEIFGHDVDDEDSAVTSPEPVGHSHSHDTEHVHSHSHSHSHGSHSGFHSSPQSYKPSDFDMDKLRSTLKQFVRDWSEEGKEEREACYGPMKDALLNHYASSSDEERKKLRVLIPGAGLGRLAYDVAKLAQPFLGFACQGNEFSHYMLLASFFILNRTDEIKKYTIYPYVHSFSNIYSRSTILRAISIPDVLPSDLPPGSDFSLVAGDFEEIYGSEDDGGEEPHSGQWNAILTCFFIDTYAMLAIVVHQSECLEIVLDPIAHFSGLPDMVTPIDRWRSKDQNSAKNIVNYLRIIHRILAPGGVWINLGPLLWHFENNNTNDPSVELDLEEVKALARTIGFELRVKQLVLSFIRVYSDFEQNESTVDTTYTNNSEGMLGYIYHAAFWTATKI
ncbi:N2227-domain-containing protein [Guyanagaster necrorhizus]|uniref:carnosine N-methyltransferase n=1 Tax=Guyanagaster necrorhizus TaxID=856835 RepID=A0A9P8ARQ4_9AGAR|nr:N2227-domain-containing protein [Guyanagaster necrorhizus MCA 3950]KAG7445355.1 N2227-domain-containing protein [Guyanagaster necrorhizus MCA 3950]